MLGWCWRWWIWGWKIVTFPFNIAARLWVLSIELSASFHTHRSLHMALIWHEHQYDLCQWVSVDLTFDIYHDTVLSGWMSYQAGLCWSSQRPCAWPWPCHSLWGLRLHLSWWRNPSQNGGPISAGQLNVTDHRSAFIVDVESVTLLTIDRSCGDCTVCCCEVNILHLTNTI
jgi:hypothetical protein